MSSFLIASLPSHSKSLKAVEFMQRNDFFFCISSNSSLLKLLNSLEGTEGGFAVNLGLSDEFKLGDEEKQLIQQFSATEVKEEVESDDEDQTKNSVDATEVKEEVESDVEQDDFRTTEEGDSHGTEVPTSQPQSTLASQFQPAAAPSIVSEQGVQSGEDRDDLLEPADADDSMTSIYPIHNDDSLVFDASLDEDFLEQETDQSTNSIETVVKEENDISGSVLKTPLVAVQTVEPIEAPEDDSMLLETIGEAEAEELNDEEIKEFEEEEEEELVEEQEGEEDSTVGNDNVSCDEEYDDAQKDKKKNGRSSGKPVLRLLFTCPAKNCPSSYKTFQDVEEHMDLHSEEQDFFCDVCKKNFSSKDDAMVHIQEKMKKQCCGCGKKFQRDLVQHHRSHTGEKPFVCKSCGKGFTIFQTLYRHTLSHRGEKPFSCGFCKKRFALNGDLKKHERTHTGEKPYKCTHCDFKCTTSHYLKIHERIHTGYKPYLCGYCKKRFAQRGDLKRHELTHTGEKPFQCSHCGRRFSDGSSLKKHIRIHTGEKPYSCKECDKKFTDSGQLKRHMKSKHQS